MAISTSKNPWVRILPTPFNMPLDTCGLCVLIPMPPTPFNTPFPKHLLGSFESSIYLKNDLCRSRDAGTAFPSLDHHVVFLSLSGSQVNYFLFLWAYSLPPSQVTSTLSSAHSLDHLQAALQQTQLCLSAAPPHPPRALEFIPGYSYLRAKVCH